MIDTLWEVFAIVAPKENHARAQEIWTYVSGTTHEFAEKNARKLWQSDNIDILDIDVREVCLPDKKILLVDFDWFLKKTADKYANNGDTDRPNPH